MEGHIGEDQGSASKKGACHLYTFIGIIGVYLRV